MKRICLYLCIVSTLFASDNIDNQAELTAAHDFLEISKNYIKTQNVHYMKHQATKNITRLNDINFSLKPILKPLKPFDQLKIHYAYPLKIFLPSQVTITDARLSNSEKQPTTSQNIVMLTVTDDFESGLLDIVYVEGNDVKNGKYLSIKLDKYIFNNIEELENNMLFTQVQYFESKIIDNNKVLTSLKPFEYEMPFSQVSYMGITYDVTLINIVDENGNYIKELKDKKYINSALIYNNKTYNYYVR
ncbi:hypothetical protein [Aliarcobacter butzleri]|uniref:hypothetical protein n=1 Tax=Aliarcobacter butzleri TaxID=28197 RepID=UPI002B254D51|nr:hypothetical protein [Aliarcobacter butzleri]